MIAKSNRNDFRAHRRKLPPEAFAMGPEGPDALPSDRIDKDTWHGIVGLPDNVSIRTSDHYGPVLKKFWSIWSEWSCLVGALQETVEDPTTSPIAHVACDSTDEFQASIYNALVGFYRLAFSSLRNVVEQMTIGLQLELANDQDRFQAWLSGDCELKFGWAADQARLHTSVAELEHDLKKAVGDELFRQRTPSQNGGFARRLFSELSNFTHGGPAFTNADIWQSNGPIFVPQAFETWASIFVKTCALGVLKAKLAQPTITALAFGSSLSVRGLFEQVVNMVPEREDGFAILRAATAAI
jgi:hypothetical protein